MSEVTEGQRNPRCSHCKELLEESKSLDGAILVNTFSPSTGYRVRQALCGSCGLDLMEFLTPDSLQSETYLRDSAALRKLWAAR